ncbi:MAG: PAS domain-containing sensor histidine kinase [Actinomycetota bacterium]
MPNPPMIPPGAELRRIRSLIADLDGIVWEADAGSMSFTFISEGVQDILGYTPAEWLADPSFWHGRLHPDDRERAVTRFVRVASAGGRFDEEYRLRAKDGDWVWLRDLGHAVKDVDGVPRRIRGLMVDITAQKAVEEEADEAERRFERVVEHLPAIVYLEALQPDPGTPGEMLYVSPQVEPLLGFTPEEWIADPLSWARQFHPDDRARIREEYERAEQTGAQLRVEYRMYTRTGEVKWFRDEAALVRTGEGTPLYWQGIMLDVTAEHEAEAREREQELRYRELVEHIPAIVYQEEPAAGGVRSIYVSPRVRERIGLTGDDWIADPQAWIEAVHPEDRERVRAENDRAERTGDAFVSEYRIGGRDGSIVWFRDEAMPVRDEDGAVVGWRGVMLDITGRKEAESQLAEAEARYRALVEQVPAITYIDPVDHGPTVYISPQVESILGYPPQAWYDDPDLWSKIVHPEDRARLDAEPTIEAPTASSYRIIAKDGRTVWVQDQSGLILDDDGNPRYWQGVIVDVTEERRTQELEADLERQRLEADRLRAEDEMKTTFLHAVSHDLRTPLAAILGLAATLERGDLTLESEEMRDMARRIAANARKLDGIVSDFLDLERLSRGATVAHFEPLDVGSLVRELVANSELVTQRRLALDVAPATIWADEAMIERIVENLLGNTVKHTPGDSRIWVRTERGSEGVLLIVEDDGPGVPAEEREAIFEPFRQGSTAGTGTGVGLALVARFAEIHGGRAWVEERPGGGASFHVMLAWDARTTEPDDDADPPGDQPTATGSSAESQA